MTSEAEVRARLSALPSPPMPDAVGEAITARLAAETAPLAEVVPLTPRHRRRLGGLLTAAAVAGLAMLLAVGTEPAGPPVAHGGPPIVKAGAIYEPAHFAQEVRERFLATPPATTATQTFADTAEGIDACADEVDAYGHVLTVDAGSYNSAPAVVLITVYPADAEYEEVWVVTPRCGAGDPEVIRHMVYDVDGSTANL